MRLAHLLSLALVLGALPAMGQTVTVQQDDTKGRVTLPTAGLVVPNVVGTRYKEAIDALHKAGFNATASGSLSLSKKIKMTVAKQTPAAGSRAPKDSMVTVDLK
jgi:hypothetical protein